MSDFEEAPVPPRAGLVLVVDDDASIRVVATRILQYGGYRVSAASSAQEALDACDVERPDLVLSDWHMPGGDGAWLLSELRARFAELAPPFAFITAHARNNELAELDGVVAVITKPFTMEQLLGFVARHVAPRPGSVAAMRFLAKPPG